MLTERNETLQGGAQQWGELFGAIADDFAMLARLHDREPDTDLLGMLKQQRFPNGLGLRLNTGLGEEALALLEHAVACLPDHLDEVALNELAADYASIYLNHSLQASPEESVWVDEENLAYQQSMFQVRGWYRRYGLSVPNWRLRPDDHLVFELQFIEFLFRHAVTGDDLKAAAEFMDEHLLRWITPFSRRVSRRCSTAYFAGIAVLTGAYCEEVRDLLAEVIGEPRPSAEAIELRMKPARVQAEAPLQYMPGMGPAV
ncbi:MAG: molecular chaperone TorD family protein [Gammaproteobacteria bacterium]|nr:molecular chaperone TorD family protein [Gammaproteobacteria bacterium]